MTLASFLRDHSCLCLCMSSIASIIHATSSHFPLLAHPLPSLHHHSEAFFATIIELSHKLQRLLLASYPLALTSAYKTAEKILNHNKNRKSLLLKFYLLKRNNYKFHEKTEEPISHNVGLQYNFTHVVHKSNCLQ